MPYTFWHNGILIGESDLDETCPNPRQRSGIFRPTAHGVDLYPRLTGFLSAGHALKELLAERGLAPEQLEQPEIEEILETTPVGRKILDIGRTLSEVEVRTPEGPRVPVASIAFIDYQELQRLTRAMRLDTYDLPEMTADTPGYAVSLTFEESGDEPSPRARNVIESSF